MSTTTKTTAALHYLLLICACNNLRELGDLTEEVTDALQEPEPGEPAPAVLVLSYGVTTKARRGFLLLLVQGRIPTSFAQRLSEDAGISDFVYIASGGEPGVPGIVLKEQRYEQNPPPLPPGYFLLAEPASLCRPDDERWIGYVSSEDETEGKGVLVYEEERKLLFFTEEEAASATAYFQRLIPALLNHCSQDYAHLHAQEVEALQLALWDAEQRRARSLWQPPEEPAGQTPAAAILQELDVWLAQHHYRLVPDEGGDGLRLIPNDQEERERGGSAHE